MNPASVLARHRAARWLAPAAVLGVAGLVASGVFRSTPGSPTLPRMSAASLIAQVQTSDPSGFSGTVVSTFALGLPNLPSFGPDDDAGSLTSLLIGSHTMQVWYGGVDKQRIALMGTTDETDVFRDGDELWQWSSADRTAVHMTVPAGSGAGGAASITSLTPVQLARHVLAMMDPTTTVRVEHEHDVADRSTYELVLTPRSAATLVGTVRIAVDGRTKVPLGVQVFARGADTPAVDVGFTSIRFGRPADTNFAFTPPHGAHVRTATAAPVAAGVSDAAAATASASAPASAAGTAAAPATAPASGSHPAAARSVRLVGTGWSRVAVATLLRGDLDSGSARDLLDQATSVSGTWGRGRLVQTPLATVLVTDDRRLLVGSVEPSVLFAAAATK